MELIQVIKIKKKVQITKVQLRERNIYEWANE